MERREQFTPGESFVETELTAEEELQNTVRQEFLDAAEDTLKAEIEKRAKSIPEDRRRLEPVKDVAGKNIGQVERIRKPEERDTGGQDLWLVVDFDDVLNHTTEFNDDLHRKLADATGMPVEEIEHIYDESKVVNEDGKKVFRFSKFIEQVKSASKKAKKVDGVINGLEYGKFIDKAVKRSLIASRFQFGDTVRISVLTFGDPKYQKLRIDRTDVADFVDDIVYTEGSKRETLQALLEGYRRNDYTYDGEVDAPFIITIDDSPQQVDDYDKLPVERRFVNMRFSHPRAKRYGAAYGRAGSH